MTHEITGAATWRSTITSPVTGEAVNQDAWDVPNQDIADCLVYLKGSTDSNYNHHAWAVEDDDVSKCSSTSASYDTTYAGSANHVVDAGTMSVANGDHVWVQCTFHVLCSGSAAAEFSLGYAVSSGTPSTLTQVDGARAVFGDLLSKRPVTIGGYVRPSSDGSLHVAIMARSPGGFESAAVYGPISCESRVFYAVET